MLPFAGFGRLGALAGALALGALVVLAPSQAHAQEEEDEGFEQRTTTRRTLAERIPAVTGRVFGKAGRLEIAPQFGLTLNDPFYQHFTGGVAVGFHILEELSISVSGEGYLSVETTPAVSGGPRPTRNRPNRPTYAARADITWAPIYGKLSLMAESVLHFDTYLSASAGVVGPLRTDPEFAWGGALGQHYFINEWLALRLEVRVQFWEMAKQPNRDPTRTLQVLVGGTVGLSFFLPSDFERESL